MLWFSFWVVFILAVVLSVPIVAWRENKQRLAAMGPVADQPAGDADDEMQEEMPAEEGFEAQPEVAEAEAVPDAVFEEVDDDAFAGFN